MSDRGMDGSMFHRIRTLATKELWQLRSDKIFAGLLIIVPLMLLGMVVSVAGGETRPADRVIVVDHDRSAQSRRIAQALENTREIVVHARIDRLADGDRALFEGLVQGLVVIPPDYGRLLREGVRPAEVLLVVDASNTFVAIRLLGTASGAIRALGTTQTDAQSIEVRPTRYFEITALQGRLAPQLGFLLYQVVLMVAGLSIVREAETGTLEQLLVTPLARLELIVGKMLPPLLVGIINFWALFAAARWIWDLPARGSVLLLFGTALLFILAQSAWGLFLSSRVRRQQQATQLIFVQILFDMAFCGYVVPVENLPGFLSWISELLPLRHYLVLVRSILLRGGGFVDNLVPIGALVALNVVFWTLGVISLRQRLQ